MSFEISYFVDERGNVPVYDYLAHLSESEKEKVLAYMKYLSEAGYQVRRPFADYLGEKTGLYELRPSRHRILYYFMIKNKIIFLHAFLKKTDAIPEREIKIALARKEISESLHRHLKVDFSEM